MSRVFSLELIDKPLAIARLAATAPVPDWAQTDSGDFPDCRFPFVSTMSKALSLGLGVHLTIACPLMNMNKDRVWLMAKDLDCLGTVIEHSHTDYYGNRDERHAWGYGRLDNEASRRRAEGYKQATKKGWLTETTVIP